MDLERLKVKVNPAQTAVLVIDMQKDYCCEGGTFHRTGFDIVPAQQLAPRLNQFLEKARSAVKCIVHLKMTKIPGLLSEAMQDHYARRGIERKYDPAYGEFYGVIPVEGDTVIPKYKYSGFISTYLDRFLRANRIKTLIITGIATNVCVESTARDGFMHDYQVVVPRDLTEGTSPEAKESSLKNVDLFFGEIVESTDLLTCWGL
jgi:ureidoacrylate peracid hydrolase